ncbi:MAG: alpha/beta fold hydrolase [Candidatus Kariarchaeaceae archaeon]
MKTEQINWEEFDVSTVPRYYRVNGVVELNVCEFTTPFNDKPPVVFIPGWVTKIEVFIPIIKQLMAHGHTVYYCELREKASSKMAIRNPKPEDFSIENAIADVKALVKQLGLEGKDFFFFGSSYGATLVTDYLSREDIPKNLRPISSILMVPALTIRPYSWQKLLIRIPLIFEKVVVAIVQWHMTRTYTNPEEPEQAYSFIEKLATIDPRKIQLSAISIDRMDGYQVARFAQKVKDKVLVVGAEKDWLHLENEARIFSDQMTNSIYVDLISNKHTHNGVMGNVAVKYYSNESFEEILPKSS